MEVVLEAHASTVTLKCPKLYKCCTDFLQTLLIFVCYSYKTSFVQTFSIAALSVIKVQSPKLKQIGKNKISSPILPLSFKWENGLKTY